MLTELTPVRAHVGAIGCSCAVAFVTMVLSLGAQGADQKAMAALVRLPIFFDSELSAKGFPNPLVKASVAGHEAIFIVDTGASVNVFADWYTEAAGIPTRAAPDSKVNDSVVPRVATQIQGHWSDGQRLVLKETLIVSFPPVFKSLHIGGILSPQFLAPADMAVVLDLSIPTLRFLPFEDALSGLRLSKPSAIPTSLVQGCHLNKADRTYMAPATVASATDPVGIDTGATGTIFAEESNIARAIGDRAEPGDSFEQIGGSVSRLRTVRDIQLLRGSAIVTLSPSIGQAAAPCDSKGLLGMDALRGCTLILGKSKGVFSCQ